VWTFIWSALSSSSGEATVRETKPRRANMKREVGIMMWQAIWRGLVVDMRSKDRMNRMRRGIGQLL
jgi:hypothetical protein